MQIAPRLLLLPLAAAATLHAERLFLDFNDASDLGKTAIAGLPSATPSVGISASTATPGTVDLGASGYLSIPAFAQPQGPFSIETRFLIDEYAPESSRFISDIFNTATWDNTIPQGISLRVGGGYLYPALPYGAYANSSLYQESYGWYSQVGRASLSRCVAELAIGTGTGSWKEVYSDRCVERGVWHHLVATFDGDEMRLFLDGHDAVDGWRTQGEALAPRIDPVATAFVGARTSGTWDSRHLDGQIDYVRIVDSAMSLREIRERYKQTLPEQDRTCKRTIHIVSPAPGEMVDGKTKLKLELVGSGSCSDPVLAIDTTFEVGDGFEIQWSNNPDFTEQVQTVVISTPELEFGQLQPAGELPCRNGCYMRARPQKAGSEATVQSLAPVAGRVAAAVETDAWSHGRPMIASASGLALSASPAVRSGLRRVAPGSWFVEGASAPPRAFLPSGREIPVQAKRLDSGWEVRLQSGVAAGLILIRSGERTLSVIRE